MTMFVVPARLYTVKNPLDDSATSNALVDTGSDGLGLSCDANGRVPVDGYSVRNEGAEALTDVTLTLSAEALAGMSQFPTTPLPLTTYVSPAPRTVDLGPTVESGRVSTSLHGTIVWNESSDGVGAADASWTVPTPAISASAAPNADHLARETFM